MTKTKSRKNRISLVRFNRRALRAAGLSGAELVMLEEIALQMRSGRVRKLRGSFLAAHLGISPQWANRLLVRLVHLGLIHRFKTGLLALEVEKISEISGNALKKSRAKAANLLKNLAKSARRNTVFLSKGKKDLGEEKAVRHQAKQAQNLNRSDTEQYWLAQMGLA